MSDETKAERRQYALLHAAALLLPAAIIEEQEKMKREGYDAFLRSEPRKRAVTEAEELLAEIERRFEKVGE